MHSLLISLGALLGGVLSAWLSQCCVHAARADASLFGPVFCEQCGRGQEIWDRIPLLSWLLNGGKCRFCSAKLPLWEPIISFLHIALWIVSVKLWMPYGPALALVISMSVSGLLCAAGISLTGGPEKPILFPLLLSMGILGAVLPDGTELQAHLIGALGMTAFCLALRYMSVRNGSRNTIRRDSVLYMGCIGLLIGWRSCFVTLPGMVLAGALWLSLGRQKKKQKSLTRGTEAKTDRIAQRNEPSAASVCLLSGGIMALVFGKVIITWYLRLFGQIG